MRQTWDGPVAKADGDQDVGPESDWLLEIADRATPAVKAAFLAALERIRGTATEEALRDALARKDIQGALRALGVEDSLGDALRPGLTRPLEDVFIAAGRATPARSLGVMAGMRFDLTNPQAIKFLQGYDFGLIKQLSADTLAGIRQVVIDAFSFGGHPYEQARTIRASIGLTENQAKDVGTYRRLLESGDRAALTRALRDRRFDPTLRAALGEARTRSLTPEQIARMVDRYRERKIAMRATTIARTETMRASNAGATMAWRQAAEKGLVEATELRRFWLVTPDDRLCPYCEDVPDLNDGGIGLDDYFQTPLGSVPYPPLHPQCRCITFIEAGGQRRNA